MIKLEESFLLPYFLINRVVGCSRIYLKIGFIEGALVDSQVEDLD